MRRSRSKKKTAFVPRGLFMGALSASSVIPLCACGGTVAGTIDGGSDSGVQGVAADAFRPPDHQVFGVAQIFADASADHPLLGVAACCFDATVGVADSAFTVADSAFGVADDAFGVAFDAFNGPDVILGVAACCFDAGAGADDAGIIHGVPPVAFDGRK